MKLEKHKRVYIPNCEDGLVEDYNVVEDAYVLTEDSLFEILDDAMWSRESDNISVKDFIESLTK